MLYFKGKEVMVMRIFDYFELKNKQWDSEILGYISQIYAEKGKQELYLKQKPSELKDLVEIAKYEVRKRRTRSRVFAQQVQDLSR